MYVLMIYRFFWHTSNSATFRPSLLDHRCTPNAVITFQGKSLHLRAVAQIAGPTPSNVSFPETCKFFLKKWGFLYYILHKFYLEVLGLKKTICTGTNSFITLYLYKKNFQASFVGRDPNFLCMYPVGVHQLHWSVEFHSWEKEDADGAVLL